MARRTAKGTMELKPGICGDIFTTHNCAVYYTEDMAAEIPEENRAADLERMNLFVIPVIRKFL